ncbi:PaaI family thioesterase [Pandoraea nosoerga]|uniref:Medium/long-chain acyl-CoA thioesterase YigI n=1 Tax=Pandoraea nosoerga TaxID=2508296 RepID=A0A5E4S027_9BURK|nr:MULTISPECIES: PaaI family thioesterase [Pandoraea]MBN4667636.1 PaaI family thioesterase [Pandoraea nosoerga]MBN4674284.1 PaaI family thioesterase [Pandoraea nosoerga]MBN4679553.1 PaaI family thioesterase [Pandoraea nosoerga]MBN4743358.1 PaaI family thioesterase [Pandoraea nosoerga]VVD67449.1 1,4-dihydroxy-2-naphthoyl-CoA hydrolase [Pandoraea nosoerga]
MVTVPVSHAAPLDDAIAAKIRASFDSQGVMTHWGAHITHLADGHCEISLPFSDKVNQQHGFFHGGVIGAIADSAGGYAGYTRISPEQELVTAEYKLNILAPGKGDTLVGRGQVVKAGRTLIVTTAELFAIDNGKWTLCALMQQTLFVLGATPAR